ncbi:glycosyltransferase [Fodinicurvata halophila]|uniref:Glycosyltransferase n=1 Tax=Fodinicurvata halophila TaxID=1419723 RepID=A0ABV8UMN9_9PROT
MIDISAILCGHREGRVSVASLRSFDTAIAAARNRGLTVQPVLVLDRPDTITEKVFAAHSTSTTLWIEVDVGDQGKARNEAIKQAAGKHVAILDGDDLWQESWLWRAYNFLAQFNNKSVIAHPEYNYFFEGQATIFRHIDQESEDFNIDLLRVTNYWDALAMAPRSVHINYPYADRDMENGWAYEDWQWNIETLINGIVHKVVPNTVLFKRRQKNSQTIRASSSKARIRNTGFESYSHSIYEEFKNNSKMKESS